MYTKQLETSSKKKKKGPRRNLEGLNSQAITLCEQVRQWPNDEWGKEKLMRMAPYLIGHLCTYHTQPVFGYRWRKLINDIHDFFRHGLKKILDSFETEEY